MIRRALIMSAPLAAALALAACGDGDEAAPGGAETAETATAAGGDASAEIQPGMWETTSTVTGVELPGAPPEMTAALIGQVSTASACVTAEQLANAPETMFAQSGQQCSFETFSLQGGRIEAAGTCAGQGGQAGAALTGTGTYTATTYEATTRIQMPTPGGEMTIEADAVGRRTGDC